MNQVDHVALVLWSVPPALMEVGLEAEAIQVRRRATDLHDPEAIGELVMLLGKIGVELAEAYVRASGYVRRAPEGIQDDAMTYQADVFTARCHVAVARAAARRVLRGEVWLPN